MAVPNTFVRGLVTLVLTLVSNPFMSFGAQSYVRPSTEEESRFRQGETGVFDRAPACDFGFGLYPSQCQGEWVAENAIWQTGYDPDPHLAFTTEDEITIVTLLIDYSRTAISLDFQKGGAQLRLDGHGFTSSAQPMIYYFPEDLSKELLFPIGRLASGAYELTITNDLYVQGPGSSPPLGSFHVNTEDIVSFTVVPEPSSLGLCVLVSVLICARHRRLCCPA
jgi:hypothetical protein